MALLHEVVGNWVKAYGSYRVVVAVAMVMDGEAANPGAPVNAGQRIQAGASTATLVPVIPTEERLAAE
jgi:hypothetical protein